MMSAKSPAIATLLSAGLAVAGCASDPRAGFERVQVGDSWTGVERLMGKPEATIWDYQATVHVWVRFEDGRATGLLMEFPGKGRAVVSKEIINVVPPPPIMF
jgi:hypothetical protein